MTEPSPNTSCFLSHLLSDNLEIPESQSPVEVASYGLPRMTWTTPVDSREVCSPAFRCWGAPW